MSQIIFILTLALFLPMSIWSAPVQQIILGVDRITINGNLTFLKDKRVGLITNHTAVNCRMESTINLFKSMSKQGLFTLSALFAPEHGLTGSHYAGESIRDEEDSDGIPIYSLHGDTRRPTDAMLKNLDVVVYDIQDIGSRSYTYISTLFYAMEECSKHQIPLIVLDRPNPLNGLIVDGPMMEEKYRSFLGYINIPYCHGMTVGELARYFNGEYKVGCKLTVITMKGWSRNMPFHETGLPWIPTSPYIPEASTAYYYPTTGILGTLSLVNIGIGFTLPFKVIGAPWINAKEFTDALNKQKFPGVYFEPFHYCPFYGKYAKENCQGALIIITDPLIYRPVMTSYLIIGILKSLYSKQFEDTILNLKERKQQFCKICGSEEVYRLLTEEKNVVWKLKNLHAKEHLEFMEKRKKYLLNSYTP